MKTIEQTNKPRNARKVRANQYGNLIAYMGRYRVFDFGLDEMSAKEWVALGCYCTFASHTGWRSITTDGCSIDCPEPPDVTIEKLDSIRHARFLIQ